MSRNGETVFVGKYRKFDYSTFNLKIAENIACKTIRLWKNSRLRCDRDNIDFVMHYIVRGFTNYNPNRGSQLRSYLIYNARRGVQDLVKFKRKKRHKIFSLDTNVARTENFARKHTLATRDLPLFERAMVSEIFEYIERSPWFNERQKIVLIEHFRENRGLDDIAQELGIHRSYVFSLFRDGVTKLKQKFNNDSN